MLFLLSREIPSTQTPLLSLPRQPQDSLAAREERTEKQGFLPHLRATIPTCMRNRVLIELFLHARSVKLQVLGSIVIQDMDYISGGNLSLIQWHLGFMLSFHNPDTEGNLPLIQWYLGFMPSFHNPFATIYFSESSGSCSMHSL